MSSHGIGNLGARMMAAKSQIETLRESATALLRALDSYGAEISDIAESERENLWKVLVGSTPGGESPE